MPRKRVKPNAPIEQPVELDNNLLNETAQQNNINSLDGPGPVELAVKTSKTRKRKKTAKIDGSGPYEI